jgi:hypothetical protein
VSPPSRRICLNGVGNRLGDATGLRSVNTNGFATGVLVARTGGVGGRWSLTVGLIGGGVYLAVSPIAVIPVDLGSWGAAIMWAAVVTGCVLATRWAYQKTHPTLEAPNPPKVLFP